MTEMRDLFHKVGNCHNKISVCAGVAKAELQDKFKGSPLPAEIEKLIERLTELEEHAVEASKVLHQLKDAICNLIDPDTGKPKR